MNLKDCIGKRIEVIYFSNPICKVSGIIEDYLDIGKNSQEVLNKYYPSDKAKYNASRYNLFPKLCFFDEETNQAHIIDIRYLPDRVGKYQYKIYSDEGIFGLYKENFDIKFKKAKRMQLDIKYPIKEVNND